MRGRRNFLFVTLFLLIFLMGFVSANVVGFLASPLDNFGDPLTNAQIDYKFIYAENSDCTGVLNTFETTVTTNNNGHALIELDTTGLSNLTNAYYICEYRGGSPQPLRKSHEITDMVVNNLYAKNINLLGNLSASNFFGSWNGSTNYVPYTGATDNVDLGIHNLSIGENLTMDNEGELLFQIGNTFRFNHGLYIGGTNGFLDVATKLLVGGYTKLDGDLNVTGNSYFDGNLTPQETLKYDIGRGDKRWNWLYVRNISADYGNFAYDLDVDGTIFAGSINSTNLNITNINVDSLNVTYINASYIYNPHFAGYADFRADPWFFGGTDFEFDGNISVSGNVSADWFNGKFNWTTGDDWGSFDGSTHDFNETKLATIYYDASLASAIRGTVDGGTIADTQHSDGNYDGKTFNFTEVAGSPGLDLRINFTGIDDFNGGVMRYKTNSLAGAYPIIQLYNYNDGEWEDYPVIGKSFSFATIEQPVFDSTDHIQDGVVQMRIYKASNGNTNNHYYIDWIAIFKGYGTPAGEEVDPYSIHRDGNVTLTGNWDVGNFNITGVNWFNDIDYGNFTNICIGSNCISDWSSVNQSTIDTNETARVNLLNQTITNSNASWLSTYNTTYANFPQTLNGILNSIAFNRSGTDVFLHHTGDKAGIGTSSPDALLHLSSGSPRLYLTDTTTGADNKIDADNAAGTIIIGADINNEVASSAVRFDVDGAEKARIDGTGLGIGTSSPDNLLHLEGSSASGGKGLIIDNTNGHQYQLLSVGSAHATLANSFSIYDLDTTTHRLIIDGDGNVGIGTSSPSQTLHVEGKARIVGVANGTIANFLGSGNTGTFYDMLGQTSGYFHAGYGTITGSNVESPVVWMYEGGTNAFQVRSRAFQENLNETEVRFMVRNDGKVGIGTSSPARKTHIYADDAGTAALLRVANDGTGDAFMDFDIVGIKTWSVGVDNSDSDKFKISEASTLDTNTRLTIMAGGNVGIGTSNPGVPLQVNHVGNKEGAVQIGDEDTVTSNTGLYLRTTSNASISVGTGGNLFFRDGGTGGTINMAINGDGNVGIGTSSPLSALDVGGTTLKSITNSRDKNTAGAIGYLDFQQKDDANNYEIFSRIKASANTVSNTAEDGSFEFQTMLDGTLDTRMIIDNNGNVGIGTTSPDKPLDVEGSDVNHGIQITNTATGGLKWQILSTSDGGVANSAFVVRDNTNGDNNLVILENGNVGIGTSSPDSLLDLNATSPVLTLNAASGGYSKIDFFEDGNPRWDILNGADAHLYFRYNDGTKMILEYGGNVGIGTSSPAGALEIAKQTGKHELNVSGILYVNSTIGIGFTSGRVGIGTITPLSQLSVGGTGEVGTGVYGFGELYGVYGEGDPLGEVTIGVYGEGKWGGVEGYGDTYDFYASGPGENYGASSSIRWKNNIIVIPNALDKIMKLNGVYFNWDEKHGGLHDMGFIAEDVGVVIPEVVGFEDANNKSNWYTDENGIRKLYASGIDYGALTPMLTEAIKELKYEKDKEVEELRKENKLMKEDLCSLGVTRWC